MQGCDELRSGNASRSVEDELVGWCRSLASMLEHGRVKFKLLNEIAYARTQKSDSGVTLMAASIHCSILLGGTTNDSTHALRPWYVCTTRQGNR